jgi:formylglycine-generating enzyme required for sulfatase activity
VHNGQKVLLVLDQFEQWLHAHAAGAETELVQALRQCDGGRLQCLVMVRDDFWLAVTRFLHSLEVRLVEGENSALVDLFDRQHARRVLAAFGRAYGTLPPVGSDLSQEQFAFLDQAVTGLAEDSKVVSVRLALFAEMVKSRTWSPVTLRKIGGAQGVGLAFLEETFAAKSAPPQHRMHQPAARRVLEALLPEAGIDIKGQMRSEADLLTASGYGERRHDFDELLRILDHEMRLITPTDPAAAEGTDSPPERAIGEHYYQLTHDYLVPSLRDWLTRKRRETRRGRAELRLAEGSALWNSKPENRHLPSLLEWVTIRTLTDSKRWTAPQRRMMKKAGGVHKLRWGSMSFAFVLLSALIGLVAYRAQRKNLSERVQIAVASLTTSRGIILPPLQDFEEKFPRELVLAELQYRFDNAQPSQKLPLGYALAHFGDVRVDYLVAQIAEAQPEEVANLVTALHGSGQAALISLRAAANKCDSDKAWRTKARLAMVAWHLEEPALATETCQVRPDPIQRTIFIDECASWHGDLARLHALANEIDDASLRSAICLGVGSIRSKDVRQEEIQLWSELWAEWRQNQPDSGTHSACGWALRSWGVELKYRPIKSTETAAAATSQKRWYVNSMGMTMLAMEPSSFVRSESRGDQHEITVTRPFWIADRELSVGQFQKFMDDGEYTDDEKPQNWPGALEFVSPSPEHPVQNVSWFDAALFANWLSRREGLSPAYQWTGEKVKDVDRQGATPDVWKLVAGANGYRLPNEDEWQYACRAGSTTAFAFGDDPSLLTSYAVYYAAGANVCGDKLPNAWGIFDAHGNVYEWCEESVVRGGSFRLRAPDVRWSEVKSRMPTYRSEFLGFRLARTYP